MIWFSLISDPSSELSIIGSCDLPKRCIYSTVFGFSRFHRTPFTMARTSEFPYCCAPDLVLMAGWLDLPVGPQKGHPTTSIGRIAKPSHRKGVRSPKSKLVHSIIREIAGFAPYERRVMELLRNSKVHSARSHFTSIH